MSQMLANVADVYSALSGPTLDFLESLEAVRP